MITLPFHPNYTILLSTRNEGSITTKEQAEKVIHNAKCPYPVGFLNLQHGSQRVHWKNETSEDKADAAVSDNPRLCLSMVIGDCFPVIIIEPKRMCCTHSLWLAVTLTKYYSLTMKELKYLTISES
jgi:copper oxidase (laccase) domain-containing protein